MLCSATNDTISPINNTMSLNNSLKKFMISKYSPPWYIENPREQNSDFDLKIRISSLLTSAFSQKIKNSPCSKNNFSQIWVNTTDTAPKYCTPKHLSAWFESNVKQEAQPHCHIFRHKGGVELIDRTYNNWFSRNFWLDRKLSIKTLSEEYKPVFFVWLFNLKYFLQLV